MSRKLSDLDPTFMTLAKALITKAKAAGIELLVVYTKRTPEEQAKLLAAGRSWTRNSKHLLGKAIDVVPPELAKLPNWAPEDPLWTTLGELGESLGLTWGGRWKQRDCPHFELKG